MCMQRTLHVHAKYFALCTEVYMHMYKNVHAHVQKCTLQQYKTKQRRAERMLRAALYVFLFT